MIHRQFSVPLQLKGYSEIWKTVHPKEFGLVRDGYPFSANRPHLWVGRYARSLSYGNPFAFTESNCPWVIKVETREQALIGYELWLDYRVHIEKFNHVRQWVWATIPSVNPLKVCPCLNRQEHRLDWDSEFVKCHGQILGRRASIAQTMEPALKLQDKAPDARADLVNRFLDQYSARLVPGQFDTSDYDCFGHLTSTPISAIVEYIRERVDHVNKATRL